MAKINDPVLSEIGQALGNDKLLEVAQLGDVLLPTIDSFPYTRKLYLASELIVPSGGPGSAVSASYRSPVTEGIEWFAGNVSAAGQLLTALVQQQVSSAKLTTALTMGRAQIPAGVSVPFLGDVEVEMPVTNRDYWIPKRIYIPAGSLFVFTLFTTGGADLANNQIGWNMLGWSVPIPRGDTLVVPPDVPIVVP